MEAAYRELGLIGRADPLRKAQILGRHVTRVDSRRDDELDAIAAALVALAFARGTAKAIQGFDGTIWVPPARYSGGKPSVSRG